MRRGVMVFLLVIVLGVPLARTGAQGDSVTCDDFHDAEAAQAALDADPSDPHGLDPDGNGVACDETEGSAAAEPAAMASPGAALPAGIPAGSQAAPVIDHRDGKTVVVKLGNKRKAVILIGLDVPDPKASVPECFAQESLDRLRKVIPKDTVVYLEPDKIDQDGKKRLLRYLWLPGNDGGKPTLVNLKMIRDGFAAVDLDTDNIAYATRFDDAERRAQDENRGLWSKCGGPHEPLPPTPTPTLTADQVVAQYQPLADVRELAIRPAGMMGQKIYFYGTILSIYVASPGKVFVLGDDNPQEYGVELQVTVAAPDGSTEVVFVGFNGDTAGMFEDSYVVVYGEVVDTQTFQNAFGGYITQPLVSAQIVQLA